MAKTKNPIPDFAWGQAYPFDVSFRYTGSGAVPTQYEWDFGDGQSAINIRDPVHTYATEGTYDVTLKVATVKGNTMPIIFQTGHSVNLFPMQPPAPEQSGVTAPTLPTAVADTTYSLPTGTTYTVNSGGNLQTALDTAQLGDVIVIEAGATFTGNFTVPTGKTGTGFLYIISSALASLPLGTRVSPSSVAFMPEIRSPTAADPAFQLERGAAKIRCCGLNITTQVTAHGIEVYQYGVVRVGNYGSGTCDRITFDRCWIHGTSTGDVRDAIQVFHCSNFALIDSYIDDIHVDSASESHGISINFTIGPSLIHNNTIEAAGINVMIYNEVTDGTYPEDVTVTRNTLRKKLSWYPSHGSYAGIHWAVKNILEIKNVKRCLLEGNDLQYSWADGQQGEGFVITARNAIIEDLTIRYNYVHDTSRFMLCGAPEAAISRVAIKHNLWNNTAGVVTRYFPIELTGDPFGINDLSICHNTTISTDYPDAWIKLTGGTTTDEIDGVELKDNLANHGNYGLIGSGQSSGLTSMEYYCVDYMVRNNCLIDDSGTVSFYYAENATFGGWMWPLGFSAVGFTDLALTIPAHFKLLTSSDFDTAATDGTAVGADIDAIIAAIP